MGSCSTWKCCRNGRGDLPRRNGRFRSRSFDFWRPAASNSCIAIKWLRSKSARAGRDFVVVTGTASGKTLCYNLPILESAISDGGRALYLFPTKALAQDQLKGLLELVASDAELSRAVRPGVYDGDTPTAQRRRIRGEANLVLVESGHAARGRLALPSEMGGVFRGAAVCGRR